jgi:hypothetical protein
MDLDRRQLFFALEMLYGGISTEKSALQLESWILAVPDGRPANRKLLLGYLPS